MNCLGLKTNITYKPRCRITFIQWERIVQGEGANHPGGERARGRMSQGAKKPNTWLYSLYSCIETNMLTLSALN